MHETLQLDKLEGDDCKYDNSFWTFQPKDPIEDFGPKFFFVLGETL